MRATTNVHPSALDDSGILGMSSELRFISVPDLAEDALRRCSIERGVRVLELECGAGDVSLSIAKCIGPSGLLVGVDRSAEAIDAAERRATLAGCCYWTRFVAADPNTFVPHERFDALVVRLTLLPQGEQVALPRLFACVRSGGIVVLVSGRAAVLSRGPTRPAPGISTPVISTI